MFWTRPLVAAPGRPSLMTWGCNRVWIIPAPNHGFYFISTSAAFSMPVIFPSHDQPILIPQFNQNYHNKRAIKRNPLRDLGLSSSVIVCYCYPLKKELFKIGFLNKHCPLMSPFHTYINTFFSMYVPWRTLRGVTRKNICCGCHTLPIQMAAENLQPRSHP